MTIEELKKPVLSPFGRFEQEYARLTRDGVPLLKEVEDYLAQTPGKRLRPLLLLLSAQACRTLDNHHIVLAAAMELLHNATLMHDDVVDESDTRRGRLSVRGKWGNQVAVLCGDYYLTQVMVCLDFVKSHEVRTLVTQTVSDMCQGELKQLKAVSTGETDTATYLDIIGSKTASLTALCCKLGALPGHPEIHWRNEDEESLRNRRRIVEQSTAMSHFGFHYGIVFQLRDDLASLDPAHDAFLPQGIDIERLIADHTRQAIEALESLPPSEARESLRSLLLPSAPQPS